VHRTPCGVPTVQSSRRLSLAVGLTHVPTPTGLDTGPVPMSYGADGGVRLFPVVYESPDAHTRSKLLTLYHSMRF
jgi:hypothetical protein